MKDLFLDRYNHFELLIFVSGVFSTFQAFTFHGITIFSWFLLALLFATIVERRSGNSQNFWGVREILLGTVIISMTVTEFLTVFNDTYPAWTSRSINNYILMSSVIILFLLMRSNKLHGEIFLKGILWSCVIQYIACFVEYIAFTFLDIDLTDRLFDVTTVLKDERITVSGLTTNPGMMVPVVLIGLCLSKNMIVKIMAILSALLVNSTTCVISVAMFFAIYFLTVLRDKSSQGWNFKRIVFGITAAVLIVFIVVEPLRGIVKEVYSYALTRITDAATEEAGTRSSTWMHYRYYWSLPYIYDHISTVQKFFGFGKNCSGIPFSELYSQYKGTLWIPETDPIATLYDVGIFGFMALYAVFAKIAIDFWKKDRMLGIFISCVLIGGIFYGFQMTWFLLLELILWDRSKEVSFS